VFKTNGELGVGMFRSFKILAWSLSLALLLGTSAPFVHSDTFKVALVLDRGGKDDKSFNAAAFMGAERAKKELGIQLKVVEASDDSFFEPALKSFADKKYDLIVAIGVNQSEAVKKVSKERPQSKFVIVDAPVEGTNVQSIMFNEHEGSYLVGAIAAMKSKSGAVGFVGGMDIPLIRRFQMGYEQGAKSVNSKIKVYTNYIGVSSEAWNNPTRAKELATSQYDRKADVIFVAAGNSNQGVFDAAEKKALFAIGVDSNQNWIKPGRILTSMVKRVDQSVFDAIQKAKSGSFVAGVSYSGLKEGAIDWALDDHNKSLFTPEDLARIQQIKAQIVAGKIRVRDYYTSR
jgi:basic membrane protein A